MRWEDERYVRVYTRDTVTWKVLPWQSRALLPLLMRKVDRAGVLDLGGEDAVGAISTLVDLPAEVVGPGLEGLKKKGVVRLTATSLVAPNFMAAQETPQSDRQRKSEQRARARDLASAEELVITEDPSRDVTSGHAESRGVTPNRAVPSRAEPCLSEPTESIAGKPRPLAEEPVRDERLKALTARLAATFQEIRGAKYKHGGVKDAQALKRLLAVATAEEINARWRLGLLAVGWCATSTFTQLDAKWNDLSTGMKPARKDPQKGATWASDADWEDGGANFEALNRKPAGGAP